MILTGGYMAGVARLGAAGWIIAAWIGIAVALVMGFALLLPRFKKLRAALPEGNAALGGDARVRVQDRAITTLIRARAVLALGIVFLMTEKPVELTTSLIVPSSRRTSGAWVASGLSRAEGIVTRGG